MKTYVLLHFEYKNDITIIIKLHRATRLLLVAPYNSLAMIVTSFLCSKCKELAKINRLSEETSDLQGMAQKVINYDLRWHE